MDSPIRNDVEHRLVSELGSERYLARRVRELREHHGWSQVELAKRLTAAGHPIHQSAISKIEAPVGSVRRNVTIDEAIGFSKAFGVSLAQLVLPPEAVADVEAWADFLEASEIRGQIRNLTADYDYRLASLVRQASASSEFRERLQNYRDEVMKEVEARLREQIAHDNEVRKFHGQRQQRWSADILAHNRPPVVVVIDDILREGESS